MEDTLLETEALGNLLREHKGGDVAVLDLRKMGAWTDFFVIATAVSETHLDGLDRHIKDFCADRGIEILRRSRKPPVPGGLHGTRAQEEGWRIIDLGSTVIHLMSREAREFYDLERLYSMTYSSS